MQSRSIREIAVLATALISAVMVTPFAFIRYANGELLAALLDVTIVLVMYMISTYVYFSRKTRGAGTVLAVFSMLAIIGIVYLKGAAYSLWVFPALMAAFYLLSLRGAIVFSIIGLIAFICLLYPELNTLLFISFLASYSLTIILSSVFITTIQQDNVKINANQRINNYRNNILELIVQSTPLADILVAITKSAELEFSQVKCCISLVDEKHNCIIIGAAPSLPNQFIRTIEGLQIEEGNGSTATAAFRKSRVTVENIADHPFWQNLSAAYANEKITSCWSEPIINSKHQVIGVFELYHELPTMPDAEHFAIIELFAQMASIAIEREHSTQLIWKQANFDTLTQLPNRHMMHEHLQFAMKNCQRNQNKMAVMFLDMDHFKDINDTLGHEFGDLLLIESAERIKQCIRKNDTVARLGGDEFVILITELNDIHGVERILGNLLSTLAAPYHLINEVIHSSASIGVTIYPDDANDIDTLLRNADQAMYGAKAMGRNNSHYFTDSMRVSAVKRMSLIKDLRNAVANKELFLVYQPIIDLSNQTVSKAEALIRWQHPQKGIISPLDFIPLAEETGLIIEISNWLFQQVVKDIKHWQKTYNVAIQISINTSPRQYKQSDGNIPLWLNWINEQEIDPKSIAFEITENLLMESQSELEAVLDNIKNAGVELSIDDFGTGYSSFSYLREFQTNYVKIDKSFVQKMSQASSDLALCEAIIVMSKKLNIKVIAEGIETEEQKRLLQDIGCDYGQGYLLSRPIPINDFEKFLVNELTKQEKTLSL